MSMTPEAKVKKKVRLILMDLGAYQLTPIGTGFGSMGAPDIIACVGGKFIGIECKAGKNKPTMLQQDNLKRIKDSGGMAVVINEENVDQLKEMIESWVNTVTVEK